MPDRTYSEREIADLIERAVERQQAARTAEAGERLSLAEIERIAAEAGIDPAHVREAADEMDAAGRTLRRESGTTATTVFVERWIDAPLTPDAWEDAVIELQTRHGADLGAMMGQTAGGTVQQIGNAYEWRHTSGLGVQTTVTASPRDGRTRLRLTQLVGLGSPRSEGIAYGMGLALLAAGAALAVAAGLDTVLAPPLWAVLVFVVALVVAVPTVTSLDRAWRGKKHAALGALADDLVPILGRARDGAAPIPAPPDAVPMPSPAGGRAAPSLDLDALPDAPDDEAARTARRARE